MIPLFFAAIHVPLINVYTQVLSLQFFSGDLLLQLVAVSMDGFGILFTAYDRNNDDLRRCNQRWDHQTIVIAMGHDHGTNQTRGNAPRSGPGQFFDPFLVNKADV
ncbi:hypothetical protein D9M71_528500 [compost metagenome]